MSANLRWSAGFFFVVSLGFSALVHAEQPSYRLAYRFQSGQFSNYEFNDRAEMMAQFGENRSKSIQQTQMLRSYRVVAVDETGGAMIEPIVEVVRMSSQSGDKPVVTYDSTAGQAPPKEFEKVAGTVGRPLARFHVAATGRLLKVSMLANDVPQNLIDAAQKTDPAMNFLIVFPEKPLKIGEKWTEKIDTTVSVTAPGQSTTFNQTIQLIRSYELAKVEGNTATLNVRTGLLTPTSDPEILRQIVQLTPSGVVEFDLAQGRILSRSMKIDQKVVDAFGKQSLLQANGESHENLAQPKLANGAPNTIPKD